MSHGTKPRVKYKETTCADTISRRRQCRHRSCSRKVNHTNIMSREHPKNKDHSMQSVGAFCRALVSTQAPSLILLRPCGSQWLWRCCARFGCRAHLWRGKEQTMGTVQSRMKLLQSLMALSRPLHVPGGLNSVFVKTSSSNPDAATSSTL